MAAFIIANLIVAVVTTNLDKVLKQLKVSFYIACGNNLVIMLEARGSMPMCFWVDMALDKTLHENQFLRSCCA